MPDGLRRRRRRVRWWHRREHEVVPRCGWPERANAFDQGLGGFSALKDQAARENEAARRSGRDPLADAHTLGDEMRAVVARERASRAAELDGPPDPDPVPFGEALRAVLAGECIEVVAEAQTK